MHKEPPNKILWTRLLSEADDVLSRSPTSAVSKSRTDMGEKNGSSNCYQHEQNVQFWTLIRLETKERNSGYLWW